MNALEILATHQVKKTSPRIAIIQALQSSSKPISENEVKTYIGDFYDRITFYRNVQTLMEAGIIHRIIVDNTTIKYALNHCEQGHHHQADHVHFQCGKCNSLVCLHDVKTSQYNLPEGYQAERCEVIIKGLCSKCHN